MNLKVAICDDEKEQLNILTDYLHKYELQSTIDFDITSFSSSSLLLQTYSVANMFHILFLDVEMPEINGLELANKIRALPDKNVHIIFVSNYPKYMQSSFNVQAYHYLQKPVAYKDFEQIMNRLVEDYEESSTYKLLIQSDGSEVIVNIRDILYIETIKNVRDKMHFHLAHETIEARGTLANYEGILKNHSFCLASRGYLVNLAHAKSLKKNDILLDNGETIPMSRRCEKEIHSKFSKNIIVFLDS